MGLRLSMFLLDAFFIFSQLLLYLLNRAIHSSQQCVRLIVSNKIMFMLRRHLDIYLG